MRICGLISAKKILSLPKIFRKALEAYSFVLQKVGALARFGNVYVAILVSLKSEDLQACVIFNLA